MEFNRILTTIDAHVAGEPLRMITGGLPQIEGKTILEKRAYFKEHYDHLRRILMYEPRGHDGMYGCVITPPVSDDADFGVLFMHNEGFSTMCGHGIICVVTMAIETGRLNSTGDRTKVVIDSPAGKVVAYAECDNGKVLSVTFENVPSFVFMKEVPIHLPGRDFIVDIAFGGAFYASKIVVDDIEGVTKEAGELIHASKQPEWSYDSIHGELTDLVVGEIPGRANDHEITFFKSVGAAYYDLAVSNGVYEEALKTQVGTIVEI